MTVCNPTLSVTDFIQHPLGRRFADVAHDEDVPFRQLLNFLNCPAIQQRMRDSEIHHDRPALAGVVKELEHDTDFESYLANTDAHVTVRFRQAIGVAACILMEQMGWRRTGRKGSLGQRQTVRSHTSTPGAYRNRSGISQWFTKSERYEPPDGYPYR